MILDQNKVGYEKLKLFFGKLSPSLHTTLSHMKSFKGIIHVHSNYSYDGCHSLEEIAAFARERGYRFVGMSEHFDTFDKSIMGEFVNECRRLSSEELLIIPGIEFGCENDLHIIGLGIENYLDSKEPLDIVKFIQKQNGLAIIAHPSRNKYQIQVDLASVVNGIEVWNAVYDGRFVPNYNSLRLLQNIRKKNDSIVAFGGQDFHRITDHFHIQTIIYDIELDKNKIIDSFRKGRFIVCNPYFKLDQRKQLKWHGIATILFARQMYEFLRGLRNNLNST